MFQQETNILDFIPQLDSELPAKLFTAGYGWLWWTAGALAAALMLTFYLLWRRKRRSAPLPPSAEEVAFDSLRQLEGKEITLRECSLRLSLILRDYLRCRLQDTSLYETHEEFSQRIDSLSNVPGAQRDETRRLLEELAELKYNEPDGEDADARVASFIARTRNLIEKVSDTLREQEKRPSPLHAPLLALALPLAAAQSVGARDFTWGEPAWLWALLVLAPLLVLRRRRGTSGSISFPTLSFFGRFARTPHSLAGRLGPLCATLAAGCVILALAQPRWRLEYDENKVSGIDIMIACDLSGSMSLRDMSFAVQDDFGRPARTTVDRLTAAKHVISAFIAGRPNDRIGLLAFAGRAKLCSPLTLDHSILNYILNQFYLAEEGGFGQQPKPGYIEPDGTAIGTAIAGAATRLEERKETKSKVIILVTDGVNNSGSISPTDAAKQAAHLGIRIFTIAIGRDERLSRYTADVDIFDEETLREIASITGGRFYRAGSGTQLKKAFDNIDSLEKTDATRRKLVSYEALFMYPLLLAALLLTAGSLLTLIRPHPVP